MKKSCDTLLCKSMLKAFFTIFLITVCLSQVDRAYAAAYWTDNSQANFDKGDFVLGTTTATANNTVQLNQFFNWFNTNWLNRRQINIDNSPSSQVLTNYQITFNLDTQSLISAGKMRPDMADIRFTASDGQTMLNYYIASASGPATQFVVKVSSIPVSSASIYMYYNNLSTATSFSSQKKTYDIYEDWESGQINGSIWTTGGGGPGGGPFVIVTSSKYDGNYAIASTVLNFDPGNNSNSFLQTNINLEMTATVTFYWAASSEPNYDMIHFFIDGVEPDPTSCLQPSGAYDGIPVGSNFEQYWQQRVYVIPQGQHTLMWQYSRDAAGWAGLSKAWIDDIVVQKYVSSPPNISVGADEIYYAIYPQGIYQSAVFDTGGQQAEVLFASWTAITGGGTSIAISMRTSDNIFLKDDTSPSWSGSLTNNEFPSSLSEGRYIQYQATLSGDGTTTPYLVDVSIEYQSPPPSPTNFAGTPLSTSSIEWTWTDEAQQGGPEEDGFTFYTSTGGIVSLNAGVTWYVENNLQPNAGYCSWVGAYNVVGTNFSGSATMYTYADPPCNNSEVFQLLPVSGYVYNPIPTGTNIFQPMFTFTSNESTTTIAYYRVAFTTNPAYSITSADEVWAPTTTVVNDNSDSPVIKKPETYFWPLLNSASWYFYSETYNQQNLPSGITKLGPYSFQGCPSAITNLTAVPSTDTAGCIVLTWTAPSAYGTQVANLTGGEYIINAKNGYYISNDTQFSNADMSFTISTNAVAGQKQSFTLTGLTPGSFWGFAIKSVNSNNEISQISTNIVTSTSTAANASAITKIVFITASQNHLCRISNSRYNHSDRRCEQQPA